MNKLDLNNTEIAFRYKSDKSLKNARFIFGLLQKPFLVKTLTKLATWVLKYKLPFKFAIKNTVFKVFCAGQNRNEAAKTIQALKNHDVNTVLDYVAEGDNSVESFENNLKTILENIHFMKVNAEKPVIGVKLSGLEDVQFLEKFSSVIGVTNPSDQARLSQFIERVDKICQLAHEKNVTVYIDAEEWSTQAIFDDVVERMMEKYNTKGALIFNTLQMYLKDRVAYLEKAIKIGREKSFFIGMKLVRGAYVEKEREYAKIKGIESPVFDTKEGTDNSYNQAVEICLKNHDLVYTCLATHNQQSVELAVELIEQLPIKDHAQKVSFSQLYGMSDNLTFNLAESKYTSSKYVPYGEVEKAIPYLLRRSEENSSIEGQVGREFELLTQEHQRRKNSK
ncbi:MAG TPA: proline dehydrogenase family protein [Fluviicola sp.]|nr:proline dehydrogenase family protein [Fluviicola sp.]